MTGKERRQARAHPSSDSCTSESHGVRPVGSWSVLTTFPSHVISTTCPYLTEVTRNRE